MSSRGQRIDQKSAKIQTDERIIKRLYFLNSSADCLLFYVLIDHISDVV